MVDNPYFFYSLLDFRTDVAATDHPSPTPGNLGLVLDLHKATAPASVGDQTSYYIQALSGLQGMVDVGFAGTCVYNNGDGTDTIIENAWQGNADQLVFTGHNFSDLRVSTSDNDLVLTFDNSADQIILHNAATSNDFGAGVESFVFADETVKTIADIFDMV